MEAPALVYRTGRFAHSAHVTGIDIVPLKERSNARSHGSILFSYMLEPYEIYEDHKTRNPSALIERAVTNVVSEALNKSSFDRINFLIRRQE
jgi:hypothetical protein